MNKKACIKLHHLIDNGEEEKAIALIRDFDDDIDVNYKYNLRILVFSAIEQRMCNLYEKIVNHHTFNSYIEDDFGESLLELLLYMRETDEIPITANDIEILDRMIKIVLNSKKYDFNVTDLNNDTAINVACEYPKLIWVVEELANKKEVNPNIINDFECTALTNAIRNKNIEAIKILSKRNDILVRTVDLKEADKVGIDLADFGFEIAI